MNQFDAAIVAPALSTHSLRVGMVGMGMIFDETYRPFLEAVHGQGLFDRRFGLCEVELAAVASRTGQRAEAYRRHRAAGSFGFQLQRAGCSLAVARPILISSALPRPTIGISTPLVRLYGGQTRPPGKAFGPSLRELDEFDRLAREKSVLAKVVYHKLFDPDHKKLRTLVADGEFQHVNNGYCSLLEPKQISGEQFAEWIRGAIPGRMWPCTTSN